MVEVIRFTEATPVPDISAPEGLSTAAAAIASAAIWRRIEAWVNVRWAPRAVTWIVEGPGEFVPHLDGVTFSTVDRWNGSAYEAVTVSQGPLGGVLLAAGGPYRLLGTCGDTFAPAPAQEAYRRLAEYLATTSTAPAGASSYEVNIGQLSEKIQISPTHMARALFNSGAADLLRPYRRAS